MNDGVVMHDLEEQVNAAVDQTPAWIDNDADGIAGCPPDMALQALLRAALVLGGVEAEAAQLLELRVGFQPLDNSTAFYDPATNTSHWIGVFQPEIKGESYGIASILSVAWETSGEPLGLLSPCVPGPGDKVRQVCLYLLQIARSEGIQVCFRVAEGMAIAADQHDFWGTEIRVEVIE